LQCTDLPIIIFTVAAESVYRIKIALAKNKTLRVRLPTLRDARANFLSGLLRVRAVEIIQSKTVP